jgi:hypothetical protein
MRKSWIYTSLLFIFLANLNLVAQTDSTDVEEEEDFSQYADMSLAGGGSSQEYCTSKITAQTPNRLIAIGYDLFGPYNINSDVNGGLNSNVNVSHGLRLETNVPVVSTNKILFSLGGSYIEQRYAFGDAEMMNDNPMYQTLNARSIRNLSLIGTLFKPFDEKNFLLVQGQADYAGDWNLREWHSPRYLKYSLTAVYGQKLNPRFIWGVGLSRTYRAGELNYVPVVMLNYTALSENWGIEMLLPARADFRYNISRRNILRFGFELEGASYRLNDRDGFFANNAAFAGMNTDQLELRRSDIRLRAMWDFSMKNFYWLSVSAGYRLVYRYNVDQVDTSEDQSLRLFGIVSDAPYLLENQMGGAFFISVVAALVSP